MGKPPGHGGGWPSIFYTLRRTAGSGPVRMLRGLHSANACKTCALGMGGQKGGMRNELGHYPEVCKKSVQAMASDLQPAIPPEFFRKHDLDTLRAMSPRQLEKAGRLSRPMILRPGARHYEPLEAGEALDLIAAALRGTDPDRSFFYFSGRSSNEAAFLLQVFARIYGCNHVHNCSWYCHQASGVGMQDTLGTGTATVRLQDLQEADLVFLLGGNPASNHPRLMKFLLQLRRRGGRVVVVNPSRETSLERFAVPSDLRSLLGDNGIATDYVQVRPGGDAALLGGIARLLLRMPDGPDHEFIRTSTRGFDDWRRSLERLSMPELERHAGIPQMEMQWLADIYRQSKGTVFAWTMGITHQKHGVENVRAIAALALLRGMVGRPGAGLLPVRGHSNVQGIGSMGVKPELTDQDWQRLEAIGVPRPAGKGLDTMACMEAAGAGRMDLGFCLGGNLFGSNPDLTFAAKAFSRMKTVVYLNTTLNTGHARGTGECTILLPVRARDEESQTTSQESMFNFVRLSTGGPARVAGALSETAIITDLGRRTLPGSLFTRHDLKDHREIRRLISGVIRGYEELNDRAERGSEFQIPGRTLHRPVFATSDGRARFRPAVLPDNLFDSNQQLALMSIRSEGQFNTVVYEEADTYRGQDRRDIILLHPRRMKELGLQADDQVNVTGPGGSLGPVLVRPWPVHPDGALMYFPEANVLFDRTVDPLSRTPAFKFTLVEVEKVGATSKRGQASFPRGKGA